MRLKKKMSEQIATAAQGTAEPVIDMRSNGEQVLDKTQEYWELVSVQIRSHDDMCMHTRVANSVGAWKKVELSEQGVKKGNETFTTQRFQGV